MTVITGSSISDDQLFGFDSLLICYFFVICKFLFANHDNCVIIIKHERNMLSWSSGQDVALSRRNQGFDSPREYQKPWNHNVPRLLTFLRYSVYHFLQGKLLCRAYSHDRIEPLAYIVGSGIQCCHSSAVKSADCSCILSTPPSSG